MTMMSPMSQLSATKVLVGLLVPPNIITALLVLIVGVAVVVVLLLSPLRAKVAGLRYALPHL